MKAGIFIGQDFEDMELMYPVMRLQEIGVEVEILGEEADFQFHGKHGYPCKSTHSFRDKTDTLYDVLVLPGGWMPDKLRRYDDVLSITKKHFDAGKQVAAICHGPWIAISAGIMSGLRSTSSLGIKDDVSNAGSTWVDERVVRDGHYVSAQSVPDIPGFMAEVVRGLKP